MVLALAVAPACGKHNEVDVLHHEANAVAKYCAPLVTSLEARVESIFKRGTTIPASTPGIDAVGSRLTEARDMIGQLKGAVVAGADGKSAVEKQAAAAAKDRRVSDLQKLVRETERACERGTTIIEDDLQSVESWIAYYDRDRLSLAIPQPAQAPAPGQPAAPGAYGATAPAAPTAAPTGGVPSGAAGTRPATVPPAAAEPARPRP